MKSSELFFIAYFSVDLRLKLNCIKKIVSGNQQAARGSTPFNITDVLVQERSKSERLV